MTTSYYFAAFYKKNGVGTAPSSTPTITIRDTTNGSTVATAQTMSAVTGLTGMYSYSYSGADGLRLLAASTTSDTTMDETDIGLTPEISDTIFTNLNGTISGLGARLPAALTANGNMKSSLLEIITTALSEGAAGRIASAFQTMFNVASSVFTTASVNQTGDSYARLGAPAGASIAADIAAIETTVAISSTQAASIATGQLAISAGYTFRQQITSTSTDDLSAVTKLWLSIKLNSAQADSASQIFIEKTAGLTVVAGAAYATAAHGSLTVGGSSGAWTIDIYIHDIATALLFGIGSDLRVAGLKYTKSGVAADDLSAWDGTAVITDGIVRAVS